MPRTCTICRHPQRHEIEADLQAGIPYRDVARRHDISQHALWRHRANSSIARRLWRLLGRSWYFLITLRQLPPGMTVCSRSERPAIALKN